MKETILIIILIICIIFFISINLNEVTYIESEGFSGRKYIVRNVKDAQKAANMLDEIRTNLRRLVDCILNKINLAKKNGTFNNDSNHMLKFIEEYINTINDRFEYIRFREDTKYNKYTSYTVNKGEEIVFCLRHKRGRLKGQLHKINELMYVAIHELAHVGCPLNGHPPLFVDINRILLLYGTYYCGFTDDKIIYKYKNYYKENEEYCGMTIDASLLDGYEEPKNICLLTEKRKGCY